MNPLSLIALLPDWFSFSDRERYEVLECAYREKERKLNHTLRKVDLLTGLLKDHGVKLSDQIMDEMVGAVEPDINYDSGEFRISYICMYIHIYIRVYTYIYTCIYIHVVRSRAYIYMYG